MTTLLLITYLTIFSKQGNIWALLQIGFYLFMFGELKILKIGLFMETPWLSKLSKIVKSVVAKVYCGKKKFKIELKTEKKAYHISNFLRNVLTVSLRFLTVSSRL